MFTNELEEAFPTQGLIAEDKGGNLLTLMFHYWKIKMALKKADTTLFLCYTRMYLALVLRYLRTFKNSLILTIRQYHYNTDRKIVLGYVHN